MHKLFRQDNHGLTRILLTANSAKVSREGVLVAALSPPKGCEGPLLVRRQMNCPALSSVPADETDGLT